MKQSKLLELAAQEAQVITGEVYTVDYAPAMNLSDQSTVNTYRAVSPGSMRKEVPTRGISAVSYQEVRFQIFANRSCTHDDVEILQNELAELLDKMVCRSEPVRLQADGKEATVKAGECQPLSDSGVLMSELSDHYPFVCGAVTIMFMVT